MSTNNTIYVGMDVHKEKIFVCCYMPEDDTVTKSVSINTKDIKSLVNYLNDAKAFCYSDTHLVCAYEAGCLGYSLYRALVKENFDCQIVAPSTVLYPAGKKRVKTDSRDAEAIARSVATHACKLITVPKKEDEEIKEYIRMRDDHKRELKKIKQEIKSFLLRHGIHYSKDNENWTKAYLEWLQKPMFEGVFQEILDEYLATLNWHIDKLKRLDERIEKMSEADDYKDKVKKLCCLPGIKPLTALAFISEVGDFNRFPKADKFASYLGLTPGEYSSGEKKQCLGITKAGNTHLRRLLVEAAQSYRISFRTPKSAALKKRQQGAEPAIINYADKARDHLRRKYAKLTQALKKQSCVAITAIARDLSGYIWGMMVGKTN